MLNETQKEKISDIAKKYDLDLILLFGSQTKNKKFLHKESDFDIAYLSKRNLGIMDEAKMICDLMQIFKSEKIDLVSLKNASPLLFYAIFQNCKILYQTDPIIFYRLRAYGFKRYIETKPLYSSKYERLERLTKQYDF